jgi:5-enolpyruvylshikimate-3-phosphate synthase
MAMALSLLSLCIAGVQVGNPEVVTKSWPSFFADMAPILGANEMGN